VTALGLMQVGGLAWLGWGIWQGLYGGSKALLGGGAPPSEGVYWSIVVGAMLGLVVSILGSLGTLVGGLVLWRKRAVEVGAEMALVGSVVTMVGVVMMWGVA
jgi:hypothetical protein